MGALPVASLALNVVIAVGAVAAWLHIALGSGGKLAHSGLASLQYFTVLSNLLASVTSAAYVLMGVSGAVPDWLVTARLVAASAVMVTFLTVIAILNPVYGWRSMYAGGNLWLHLVVPLLAAFDCCLFVTVAGLSVASTAWAMVPVLVYGAWYLSRILSCTDEETRRQRDFYGFCRWGMGRIPLVYAVMLLIAWGVALLLRLAGQLVGLA